MTGAGLGALYVAALAREGAAVTADLTREAEVARMAEAALGWRGRIDVLVNNAGGGSSETASATTLAEESPSR
jgi:glucose 1-dehydrogenase/3-oxoacyl-[acyl-carrier protein] reductase